MALTNRRAAEKRYKTSPKGKIATKRHNKKWYAKNGKKYNASRRKRYAKDSDWRSKVIAGVKRSYNTERRYVYTLRKKYGLTLADVETLKKQQNGCCAICTKKTKLHVDHDHKSEEVRGLLCNRCNLALGLFDDDSDRLMIAATYLGV